MMKRYGDERIIQILRGADTAATKAEVCREYGISERTACEAVGMDRSTYRYAGRGGERAGEPKARIAGLAEEHERYGYGRITAVLRRDGERVDHERVWRVWKAEGLSLPRRRPKKRRMRKHELPTTAEYGGRVWTYDFVFDRTESDRVIGMLVVLDEYARERHRIRVEYGLGSEAVAETLSELF